ncbi:MAG: Spy/CpxP family protein refolding chaperone [Bryobacteraceae bacterium]|jgi:Spy/CpxP family protein refolding chaperone
MIRLILLLFTAGALFAQAPPGFFNWWDSPIANDLNLSEDQKRQIRSIVQEYRDRLIDQRAAVQKAELQFADLFAEPSPNPARVDTVIEQLAAARADLTRTMSRMTLRLRGVLTQEQFQELQKRLPRMQPGPGMGPRMREFQNRRRQQAPPKGPAVPI